MVKQPKLMVVDDEIDICNFVKSFFEMRGFKVTTALNGDEAMSKLLQDRPDIVILDVKMRRDDEARAGRLASAAGRARAPVVRGL